MDDALTAEEAGADAIGLVLYEKSPRFIEPAKAAQIRSRVGPFTSVVTLLVNASAEFVENAISVVKPDLLQFHGDESDQFCSQFDFPYIRAIRVVDREGLIETAGRYAGASALLFDTWDKDAYGGTGKIFDWTLLPDQISQPLILAGGLNADNVQDAIRRVRPYAVDVSGGVETSPGIKDYRKIKRFIENAKAAI